MAYQSLPAGAFFDPDGDNARVIQGASRIWCEGESIPAIYLGRGCSTLVGYYDECLAVLARGSGKLGPTTTIYTVMCLRRTLESRDFGVTAKLGDHATAAEAWAWCAQQKGPV